MKLENDGDTYHGPLGLDRLPKVVKTLIAAVCFTLAAQSAISNAYHISMTMGSLFNFVWLSIISPVCVAVAVMRLAGVKWRYALLLFILVPIAVVGAYYAMILYGLIATGNA